MDGVDPLPDEDAAEGEYRDESARSGVQHETRDDDLGYCSLDEGYAGLKPSLSALMDVCSALTRNVEQTASETVLAKVSTRHPFAGRNVAFWAQCANDLGVEASYRTA